MIKDTFCSWPRLVHLCRKEMIENWRAYILRMVLMYGVLAIAFILNGMSVYTGSNLSWLQRHGFTRDPGWDFVLGAFVVFFFIFGCISASFLMERMKRKTSRLSVLMTPVTPFEYFISRWTVYTIAFIATYLLAFMLADWTRVLVFSIMAPKGMIVEVAQLKTLSQVQPLGLFGEENSRVTLLFVQIYFFFQSFFILGSTVWPKNAFLRTFAAGVALILGYVLLGRACVELGVKSNSYVPDTTFMNCCGAVLIVMTLVNWVLAYYRFKESEIINRM